MTDLLDRADLADPDPDPEARPGEVGAEAPAPDAGSGWILGAALFGAGAIHLAMAPSHLGESAVEGTGFVVAGWVQLLLGVAVLRGASRWILGAVAGSSLALIAAWALSRTAGLPFGEHSGHAESISLVDGVAVGLEVVALLAVLAAALRRFTLRPAVGVVGAVAALAFATAAVASPSARDHASGSHGEHGGNGHAMGSDDAGGAAGHAHGSEAAEADDKGFSQLSNGHQHEFGQDEPLTAEETVLVAQQLSATTALVEQFPTLAHAEAAGWRRAGPFAPGLGTHYGSPDYVANADGDMDPEDLLSPMLIFDGLEPDAQLAGFMFQAYGTQGEPEGFAGPNDHWHYHENLCIRFAPDGVLEVPLGADLDTITEEMCTEVDGMFIQTTGYMVHVWNVPGYESPNGTFTELNPKITCPDGTYHRIPTEEVGTRDTVCRNG